MAQRAPDLRVRVVLAMFCLTLAKLVNVYVPFLYKDAVDSLSGLFWWPPFPPC